MRALDGGGEDGGFVGRLDDVGFEVLLLCDHLNEGLDVQGPDFFDFLAFRHGFLSVVRDGPGTGAGG
jgi:hypothetical protein